MVMDGWVSEELVSFFLGGGGCEKTKKGRITGLTVTPTYVLAGASFCARGLFRDGPKHAISNP